MQFRLSGESTVAQASRHHSRCHRLTTCSTVATRGFPALTAVAWPAPLVAWPLDYLLSCVSLRSSLPSAFTMYTSRLCRKAIVRPSGDHAKERGTFSAWRVSRRSPLPSAFTT